VLLRVRGLRRNKMAEKETKKMEKKEEKVSEKLVKDEKVEAKDEKVSGKIEKKDSKDKVEADDKAAAKDNKKETKDKKKEVKKVEIPKKDEAVANGSSLHISKKHAMYICSYIKGKRVDTAIADLNEVIKMKRVIPFKGEIPHRKGKGMMSGRYPIKASGIFISLLKGLKGNIIVNGMEPDKAVIYHASASWAARPMKSGGRLMKRTNVILKAKELKNG